MMKKKILLTVFMVSLFCFKNILNAQQVTVNDHTSPLLDTSSRLRAPAFEEMPVYRLQLRLTTGRDRGAGTDNPVYVQMNTNKDTFYLVKGVDNFEEGKVATYDVLIKKIKKVKDIDFIRFGVNGGDGLCLKKVELLLNNYTTPLFAKEYPGQSGACFDKGSSSLPSTLEIAGSELRASSKWNYRSGRNNLWRPPMAITNTWIASIIEAAIGNQIYQDGGDIKWGTVGGALENKTLWGKAVEMNKVSNSMLHFDLDLEVDRAGPNPELDVDFDISFTCNDGEILTEVKNVKIGTDDVGKVLDYIGIAPRIANIIFKSIGTFADKLSVPGGSLPFKFPETAIGLIADALRFNVKFDVNNPGLSQGCALIKIGSNGSIDIR